MFLSGHNSLTKQVNNWVILIAQNVKKTVAMDKSLQQKNDRTKLFQENILILSGSLKNHI